MLRRLILPVALFVILSACAAREYDWIVKINDKAVKPDEFVAAQMHAHIEAQSVTEYSTATMKSNIDGEDSARWINDHALRKLKRDVFIEEEFQKRNLRFGNEADEFIRIFGEEGWVNVSRLYENNNLDKEHYFSYLTSLYKEQLVFNAIYLYDEETKVTDREIEDYLDKNISRMSFFRIARVNDDGSPVDLDQEQQLDSIADDAVSRINSGEKMSAVASDALTQSGRILGSRADFSDGQAFITTEYITKASVNLLLDFMEDFFTLPVGRCVSYELEDCYYICQKIELCDTQSEYMYLKQDVVNFIRDMEFEEMISEASRKMSVEFHPEAVKIYTPDKLNMTIG